MGVTRELKDHFWKTWMIRLIVIDEDELVRNGIRQMLQDSKLQVVAVSDSGARILAGIEQFQPHVILLDMPLENDDSFTALRQAKSKHPEIPVLMLSTFDDPITASRAAGLGASGVLLKPLNRKQIIQEVKGVYKHVLTEEIAEQFVTDDNSVDLSEFTVIEAVAARVLKRHNGPLNLGSLAELTEAAAESLSRHNGILRLDGLTQISNEAAECFIVHKGALYLDSLGQLTEASAESFGKHEGYKLSLNGLASLSNVAAEHLSRHGSWFESDEGEIYGDLCLDGLTELSDAAAESLGKHEGGLSLAGLTLLSDPVAESLSKHQGWLQLYGLTELSDTGAGHLAKHPNLTINLDNIPESAAQILRDAGHG